MDRSDCCGIEGKSVDARRVFEISNRGIQIGYEEGPVRINSHITVDINPANVEFFARLGVDLEKKRIDEYVDWTCLDFFEDDPRWEEIWQRFKDEDRLHLRWSVFDKQEVRDANFCTPNRFWQHGYPQPDDAEDGEDDYMSITYDSTHYCGACGTGLVQKAPFRLRGEPKWGRRSLMGLNWIWDEIFTTPTVWREVFRPFGIECRPVVKNKTGAELETCVQLVIDNVVDHVIPRSHPFEYCPVCQITRWEYVKVDFFPKPAAEPSSAICKSAQYFGTGHASHNQITISKALYAEIERRGLKGIDFGPCAE